MHRISVQVFAVVCGLLLFSLLPASADGFESETPALFVLPSSLQEIEDGAFSGTAVETVVFPEGLQKIGENAFKDAWQLRDIYIPDLTAYIDETAFPVKIDMTIHGIVGSIAQKWAEKHNVSFVSDDIWKTIPQNEDKQRNVEIHADHSISSIEVQKDILSHERNIDEGKSRRPQDRSELYPIDYRFP